MPNQIVHTRVSDQGAAVHSHHGHRTADQASIAVQAVIADAGFAVEIIHNDYGEDLLVQTSHADEVDASRLWIQVKGTTAMARHRRRFGCAHPVGFKHAIKWARSSDPVVVVLWDVAASVGYLSHPKAQVEAWHDRTTGAQLKTLSLRCRRDDVFDRDAVLRLRGGRGLIDMLTLSRSSKHGGRR
jgi:hypothetical protein